jgi:hypothetical protein
MYLESGCLYDKFLNWNCLFLPNSIIVIVHLMHWFDGVVQ